ncbi:MAG TPA: ABC transporter permease, partial [Streptosporangiaceae bacterium]|nr:ABC transporter permease [Streptosporangiaceae bacterium]
MRAALLICLKDMKARLRDRSALLIGIVVPLGLAFIFNSIFSGISGNSKAISLGVVSVDRGAVAQQFTGQVLGAVGKSGLIAIHREPTVARARALAASGTLDAVIVIPAGFSTRVQANQPASLQVIGNIDAPISTQIARSIAEGYAASLNRVRLSVATVIGGHGGSVPPGQLRLLAAKAAAVAAPVAVSDVSAKTRQLDQKSFFAAGMAVFFLFFTVQFGVTSLLEERNEGTLARLLAAPIARTSILGGKLLTSFLLGVISMVALVVATSLLFGASWGNPLGVAVLVVAAILAATGIMAFIATLARNADQAANWQSVVAVVLGLIGGTFFPVSQAPGILSKLTFVAPQAWFMRGLGDLRGGGISVVWVPALAMLGFAVVLGGIAMTRLRHLA